METTKELCLFLTFRIGSVRPMWQDSDIEVETTKERSVARRCQSLQRFLLEQLHRELAQRMKPARTPASNPVSHPGPSPSPPASPPAGAERAAAAANGAAPAAKLEEDGLPGAGSGLGSGPDAATVVQQLFQLAVQQRTLFLSGIHRHKPGLVRLHDWLQG